MAEKITFLTNFRLGVELVEMHFFSLERYVSGWCTGARRLDRHFYIYIF